MRSLFSRSLLAIPFIVSITDGVLKNFALKNLPGESLAQLSPIVTFAVHRNTGIAFNIPIPLWIIIPLTVVLLMLLSERLLCLIKKSSFVLSFALTNILCGASNNLIDRMLHGFTTDYCILLQTSAINLSDLCILFGVSILFVYTQHNPHAFQILIQDSPSCYGFFSRAFRSAFRFISNTNHR